MAQPIPILRPTRAGYVCEPGPRRIGEALAQLWEFRSLVGVFVRRDLRLRYANTALGAGWSLLQPLGYLAVFSLMFHVVGGAPDASAVPYPLFLFPGLVLWQLLARILSLGASSVDAFRPLLSRVFFPRMIAPLTAATGAAVDFAVASSALVVLMVAFRVWPGWPLAIAPLFVALTLALGLGAALWLTALDAKYRDLRQPLAFFVQLWMFGSPVIYPLARVPAELRPLYWLNPMTGALEGFRFALVPGAPPPSGIAVCASIATAVALLVSGAVVFNAREGTLVDEGSP
jgi:lipopolysaccharide transport system permease protein